MIKKTLYFGNPAYLSLRQGQMVIKLPEVETNDTLPEVIKRQSEVTKPIGRHRLCHSRQQTHNHHARSAGGFA